MSAIGRRGRKTDMAWRCSSADAAPVGHAESLTASTPYWLLWSTGVAAFVLGALAFILWGTGSAGTVFDMIVAFCT
jgi:hypothetical protein